MKRLISILAVAISTSLSSQSIYDEAAGFAYSENSEWVGDTSLRLEYSLLTHWLWRDVEKNGELLDQYGHWWGYTYKYEMNGYWFLLSIPEDKTQDTVIAIVTIQ